MSLFGYNVQRKKNQAHIPFTNRVWGLYCKLRNRVFSVLIYGPSTKCAGHKSKRKKRGSVTYSTDWENEVSKIFIISLCSKRWLKQSFEFSGLYSNGIEFNYIAHFLLTYPNALYKWSMGEIRHQNIQAPLAAASSPLAISFSTLTNEMRPDHKTRYYMPHSLWQVCGFFYVPQDCVNSEGLWDRPTVYCPYSRRLERKTVRCSTWPLQLQSEC